MANWKHKVLFHERHGKYLLQVNVPIDSNIMEHEIVVFVNGTVVDRASFWDNCNDHNESMVSMVDHLLGV